MFGAGFGWPELLIVAVIILLLFGASKLTDIGSSLGKGIREFRKVVHEEEDPKPEAAASQNDPNAKKPFE